MKKFLVVFILISYNLILAQSIKSPSEFLGYELGTEFTRHHKVVDYYKYLADAMPDQVKIEFYGETNEKRPLFITYISTSKNISNLENIRESHLKSITGKENSNKAIVWLSYNVHGNESVSTEASMKTIYELLTKKEALLENTIIIIDPCLNPDGRDRYVNWYYQNKNATYNADPKSIEHNEPWLNGRPNHYMFDLNRDWAWLTQIESQQRIKIYNKWLPHIHVDFHEQGVEAPYYFAPAAEPYHEVITDFQRNFQNTIGKNHASYFDTNGWDYFTKEVFDLLYPSYGDTYPLYNGAIGMTYEQGGSGRAGLGVLTQKGDTLTLEDRIDHHFTTGISTVEVASKNIEKLNSEFENFYNNKEFKYKSYVLNGNANNLKALTKLLDQHEVKYGWTKPTTVKGLDYASTKIKSYKFKTDALVVSTDQPKGTLVKVLFEPSAKLSDSLTYDITAWSLPYAYGLNTIASETKVTANATAEKVIPDTIISENTYAYITGWNSMNDARFLADLLQKNINVRFSQKAFSVNGEKYDPGSLIITKADNKNTENFIQNLTNATNQHTKALHPTSTGFVDYGPDFGASSVHTIKKSRIAVLTGNPTRTLQFGEVWHFFEQQLNYPITVLDAENINLYNLNNYDILILPNGRYDKFLEKNKASDLQKWVSSGGKLIAMGGAIKALEGKKGFSITSKKGEKDSTDINKFTTYEESEREGIKKLITGAIFKTKVDNTNPLAYGYNQEYFTLKLGNDAYEYLENGNVVYLEKNMTPVSGFAGSEAQKKINETLVFGVENIGHGQVIYMVDNPIFRGFWENGKLFFANALFMVD